ncbi:MAG: DUF3520 domain-containing protein [Planctomycetes bacterium]|nr:DUF3520 domain-containing protein [Planctomycetota bacterium]
MNTVIDFPDTEKEQHAPNKPSYDDVLEMAESAMREDALGYRSEFVDLVYRAIEVDN